MDTTTPDRPVRPRERGQGGRLLAGVCAGLGRYTGIDPIVFRLAAVLLVIASGSGVLVYVVAWLLMPVEDEQSSFVERHARRRFEGRFVLLVIGFALALGVLFNLVGTPRISVVVPVVILGLGVLVAHARGVNVGQTVHDLSQQFRGGTAPRGDQAPPTSPPAPNATSGQQVDLATLGTEAEQTTTAHETNSGEEDAPVDLARLEREIRSTGFDPNAPTYVPAAGQSATTPPAADRAAPARRRGPITPVTLAVAALAGITLFTLADGTMHDALRATQVALAAALVVVGIGRLCGAWYGRTGGLSGIGVLLSLGVVASLVAGPYMGASRHGVTGDARWRPTSIARLHPVYRVRLGSGRLDLTGLPLRHGRHVDITGRVRLGRLEVVVPRDAEVRLTGEVRRGDVRVDGREAGTGRSRIHEIVRPADRSHAAPVITVRVDDRFGEFSMRRR